MATVSQVDELTFTNTNTNAGRKKEKWEKAVYRLWRNEKQEEEENFFSTAERMNEWMRQKEEKNCL